jgi:hypothetical protein
MFAIVQQLNAVSGGLVSLSAQVKHVNDKVDTMTVTSNGTSREDNNATMEALSDLKKLITKVQLELIDKYNEIRKDIETIKRDEFRKDISKEIKLLETSLVLKVETMVNKMVKDRTETLGTDLKQMILNEFRAPLELTDKQEDYELNVTLTGEKEEVQPKKRSVRSKKQTA